MSTVDNNGVTSAMRRKAACSPLSTPTQGRFPTPAAPEKLRGPYSGQSDKGAPLRIAAWPWPRLHLVDQHHACRRIRLHHSSRELQKDRVSLEDRELVRALESSAMKKGQSFRVHRLPG